MSSSGKRNEQKQIELTGAELDLTAEWTNEPNTAIRFVQSLLAHADRTPRILGYASLLGLAIVTDAGAKDALALAIVGAVVLLEVGSILACRLGSANDRPKKGAAKSSRFTGNETETE